MSDKFECPVGLSDPLISLRKLREDDFEGLYLVASDPLIWEQHPNPDRYKREVFKTYFEGAIASNCAFLVTDIKNGNIIGCSRYYDFDKAARSVCIGYTFLSRACWGKSYNRSLKTVMLNYAFN